MAIDRGPWNALVDDDGSNLVGSVWNKAAIKTVLLDPMDAAIVPPVVSPLTLVDASGAGLGTLATGSYVKQGPVVQCWAQILYPATANAATTKIGGFPFVPSATSGATQGYGVHRLWFLPTGEPTLYIINPTTGATLTNAAMSGSNSIIMLAYLTTA